MIMLYTSSGRDSPSILSNQLEDSEHHPLVMGCEITTNPLIERPLSEKS